MKEKIENLEPKHLISIKDYLASCIDSEGTVKYSDMFSNSYKDHATSKAFEFLDNIFDFIDLDHNGTISTKEANEAITLMNQILKTKYTTSFISQFDLNKDGIIDLQEFRVGFSKAFNLI